MRHHLRTRIVLANSAHARWIEREGERYVTLAELDAHGAVASHPTTSVHESGGHGRHGAGEVDLAARSRDRFAAEIARRLEAEDRQGAFERLAIVAPPKMLHAIRESLDAQTRAKIVHEAPKDLIKIPPAELGERLGSVQFG